MLPTFICVGPGRAGTSWLYEILREHPEVCMAKGTKETQYFNENFERGIVWYENFFHHCNPLNARGEISNRYIFDFSVAPRIKRLIPDCKIIICLRNPYERIQSVYSFKLREVALDCTFEESLVTMPSLLHENKYYTLVKPYFELFHVEDIFILLFEDIASDPFSLCRNLYSFLGVDPDFVPSKASKVVNSARTPRIKFVAKMLKQIAGLLRRWEYFQILTWAKRSETIKKLVFTKFDYTKKSLITPTTKSLLDSEFEQEIFQLEALLQKNLETWRKS